MASKRNYVRQKDIASVYRRMGLQTESQRKEAREGGTADYTQDGSATKSITSDLSTTLLNSNSSDA